MKAGMAALTRRLYSVKSEQAGPLLDEVLS